MFFNLDAIIWMVKLVTFEQFLIWKENSSKKNGDCSEIFTLMRIAFVSYEFPPDTGIGGIATYVKQISQMLSTAGFGVEVVCASPEREGRTEENEMLAVTRVRCMNTEE